MENTAQDTANMTSEEALCSPVDHKTRKRPGFSNLKLFIVALSFAYFSKALTGTYMKSSITQIERRFDLSSTHIGLIDGSFEMGNLLFLAVVSHFGAKLHRPRLIAAGCFLMAVGAFLTGLTHFFMGRYKYDTVIQVFQNDNLSIAACVDPLKTLDHVPEIQIEPSLEDNKACVRDSGSSMWIYVFLGNALRGIGETPVTPLGISYIDDFAKAENSPFYIACLQTITLLGPMFGFLLGSYCARLYVDIGYVDMDSVTITSKDSRWVGAWWMGFLVSSGLLLISSIPFWFLPRSMPKQESEENHETPACKILNKTEDARNNNQNFKLTEIAKGFLPSLRRLLGTPAYFLLLCGSILKFNAFIGLLTFKAKYMEQQFGQSASRANFLIGVLNLPAVAIGIFLGGLLMKRYKLSLSQVFHNCTCVSTSFPAGSSTSVRLGQCPHAKDCSRSFTSYMAISVLSSFINALGATPGYMVIIRCITPELKSLALGIQTLVTRTLGGIPAPVYFGALIDSTCLKWSMKSCGGRGACRIYNSDMYRIIFLGLITCISGSSYFFLIAVIILLRRQFRKPEKDTDKQEQKASKDFELKTPLNLTEEIRASPETPNLPSATKIWVKIATDLEEGGEVHTVELPPHNDGVISTSNAQEAKYMTDTCAEVIPLSSDGTNTEIVRKESIGHKVIEKQDDHIDDKSKLEKERQQLN
ncbi:solute carrier organic anion transporter family member 1C1-like [Pundamilia nyererei]|uniref:Solute carrier organic anion transporter family member n=1 Tax=Pundamilia nyererei TaxID=303518 RepID=A0A9Y3VDY0_9CICH|nr:PREDICTED: solute carrier organic anion transporter family member 1C1-like [Pundamilia nyererei]